MFKKKKKKSPANNYLDDGSNSFDVENRNSNLFGSGKKSILKHSGEGQKPITPSPMKK